jgi:CheY-like chemotaxis protein
VEAIRGDAAASAIPIVVTSGWARRIAPPTPVAAWLPKPFEPRELLEVLHRLVPGPAPVPPGTA